MQPLPSSVRLLLRSPLLATEARLVAHTVCDSVSSMALALQFVCPRAPDSVAGKQSSTITERPDRTSPTRSCYEWSNCDSRLMPLVLRHCGCDPLLPDRIPRDLPQSRNLTRPAINHRTHPSTFSSGLPSMMADNFVATDVDDSVDEGFAEEM